MTLILNPKPHLTHYEFVINETPYRIIATEATATNALHTVKNLKTKEIRVVDMYSLIKWFNNQKKPRRGERLIEAKSHPPNPHKGDTI